MSVPREEEKLRFGRATTFDKGRLKRLRQEDETWEADFQALPKPITQSRTDYRGMVVASDGSLLAESQVEGRPTVNDMAALLADAMRRPLAGTAHRPRRLHVRGHHQWRELFPHLAEIGIEVAVQRELPRIEESYHAHLRHLKEVHARGKVKPTAEQAKVAEMFPAVARYVERHGYVEIGEQELFGFIVRAIGDGGTAYEDDKPNTLAEALAALEKGLKKWFQEQRIDLEE
jgi:hypothetical protein